MSRVWNIVRNPALQNPRPAAATPLRAADRPPSSATPAPFQGANLWAAWHRRALSWAGGDDTAWVNAHILTKLPCGDCSRHAKAYVLDNPPDFTAAGYFPWTVAFHNAVNARLGRPTWSLDEAREYWSKLAVL